MAMKQLNLERLLRCLNSENSAFYPFPALDAQKRCTYNQEFVKAIAACVLPTIYEGDRPVLCEQGGPL